MFSNLGRTHKGILLALLGYTAFAFADTCAKWLTQIYPLYQIIAVECAIACLIMLAFSKPLGGIQTLKDTRNVKMHTFRGVINFMVNMIIIYCFSYMSLATIYTAVFMKPFVAVLIAIPLFKEKVSPRRWGVIITGFIGVMIAFQPWQAETSVKDMTLLATLTVLIAIMFLSARYAKDTSPLALGFYPVFGCLALTMPIAIPTMVEIAPIHLLVFAAGGAFISVGIVCVSLAFQKADAGAVSPMMYTEMFWGLLFGYLLFSDIPNKAMIIGVTIIIASGIYLIKSEHKKSRDA